MKTKNIKVTYSTRWSSSRTATVPKIQMEGRWLEELGFAIGSTIAVEYGEGSITIRPLTQVELETHRQAEIESEIRSRERELKFMKRQMNCRREELGRVAESSGRYELSARKSPSSSESSAGN